MIEMWKIEEVKAMQLIKRYKKILIMLGVSALFMGAICLLLYEPIMDILKDPTALKRDLDNYGIFGMLILSLIMALQVVFVFLPGEIIEVLAGFLYGPINGMIVCLIGAAIGSIIIYLFVSKLGIRFVEKYLGKDKINDVKFLNNHPNLPYLLFLIFFIPGTPKDIITYFMPFTGMKLSTFLMITSVARIPSVITSIIGGNAIGMQQYEFCILVFAITGVISLAGLYFYKRKIHTKKPIVSNL